MRLVFLSSVIPAVGLHQPVSSLSMLRVRKGQCVLQAGHPNHPPPEHEGSLLSPTALATAQLQGESPGHGISVEIIYHMIWEELISQGKQCGHGQKSSPLAK